MPAPRQQSWLQVKHPDQLLSYLQSRRTRTRTSKDVKCHLRDTMVFSPVHPLTIPVLIWILDGTPRRPVVVYNDIILTGGLSNDINRTGRYRMAWICINSCKNGRKKTAGSLSIHGKLRVRRQDTNHTLFGIPGLGPRATFGWGVFGTDLYDFAQWLCAMSRASAIHSGSHLICSIYPVPSVG